MLPSLSPLTPVVQQFLVPFSCPCYANCNHPGSWWNDCILVKKVNQQSFLYLPKDSANDNLWQFNFLNSLWCSFLKIQIHLCLLVPIYLYSYWQLIDLHQISETGLLISSSVYPCMWSVILPLDKIQWCYYLVQTLPERRFILSLLQSPLKLFL